MGLYQWVGPGTDIGDGDNWRNEIAGTTGTEPDSGDDVIMFAAGTFTGGLNVDSISLQSQGSAALVFADPGTYIQSFGTTATTVTGLVTFDQAALYSNGLAVETNSTLSLSDGASFIEDGGDDANITIGSQMGTAALVVDHSSFFAQMNAGTLTVGEGSASVGMLTIEGGTGWHSAAALTLIGDGQGASSQVLVTGAQTGATFDGRVEIGGAGNGSFTVAAGAYASLGLHDNVAVGSLQGTGTITATGANSLLSVAGNLEFGAYGGSSSGTGIVSSGGTLAVAGDILVYAGSISVGGTGSVLSGRDYLPQIASDRLSIGKGGTAQFIDAYVQSGSTVQLQGGTLAVRRVLENTASIGGYGVVRGTILNYGTITATGGTLTLTGPESGSGIDAIAKAATLELDGSVAASARIAFQFGANTLSLKDAADMAGLIRGFGTGDRIDLLNDASTSMSFAKDVLTIQNGNTVEAKLHFAGSYSAADFKLSSDGQAGTLISYTTPAPHSFAAGIPPHSLLN